MQKIYSACNSLRSFPKCNLTFLAQGKQQKGKNRVHLTVKILKVEVDPYKATQRARLFCPVPVCMNKKCLTDPA